MRLFKQDVLKKVAGLVLIINLISPLTGCTGKKIKVVAIGDSLTYGFPYGTEYSWVQIASEKLKIKIVNKGINGETTMEMKDRFEQAVLQENPTHVIIMGGSNDAFYQIPLTEVQNNIAEMGQKAAARGIKVIIGLPIPINDLVMEQRLSGYRFWMASYAKEQGWGIIDFYSALLDIKNRFIDEEYDYDGVHPNIDGYDKMAEAITSDLFR